jgi:hypothetical protein
MDRNWREMAKLINLDIPIYKIGAFEFLTSIGKRFCLDFGTDNAIEIARAEWIKRKRRKV